MSHYQEGKKTRRIAAVIYIFIMTGIVGGSYLAQQQDAAIKAKPGDFSDAIETTTSLSAYHD